LLLKRPLIVAAAGHGTAGTVCVALLSPISRAMVTPAAAERAHKWVCSLVSAAQHHHNNVSYQHEI
jgi:hypothetical protein